MKILHNFHTHTKLCRHASGMPLDYALAAHEAGLHTLGFSDHIPFPDGRWSHVRMDTKELDLYLSDIDEAARLYPGIRFYKGLETEWIDEFSGYLEDEILGQRKVQYLCLGNHWFYQNGECINGWEMEKKDLPGYAAAVIKAARSGLISFIAHPDIFIFSHPYWDEDTKACSRDILEACSELAVPLEINALGLRRDLLETEAGKIRAYPFRPFWEMASQYPIKVVVNSDAHSPIDLTGKLEEAYELAEDLKFEPIVLFEKK